MTKKENKCANRLEFMRPGPRRITKRRDGSSYLYMQVLEFFRVFSKIENTIVSLIQGGEARRPPPPGSVFLFRGRTCDIYRMSCLLPQYINTKSYKGQCHEVIC